MYKRGLRIWGELGTREKLFVCFGGQTNTELSQFIRKQTGEIGEGEVKKAERSEENGN